MIPYTESGGALVFRVQVVPRASRSEIVGMRAAAGTAGVSPALSAKREQRLLAFGSFAGETPAVPAAAHNGALRVRIAAAPVDGAANEELVRLLACTLRVPRSAVEITAGRSAKLKTVRVADLESSAIRNLFVPHGPKR